MRVSIHQETESPEFSPEAPTEFNDRLRRNHYYCKITETLLVAGALVAMLLTMMGSWDNQCDQRYRIWVLSWSGLGLTRSILSTIVAGIIYYVQESVRAQRLARIFRYTILDFLSFTWFGYGIYVLFVKHDEPSTCQPGVGRVWAMVAWCLQASVFFMPCLMVILLIPILLCCLRSPWMREQLVPWMFGSQLNESRQPTPVEVIQKLPQRNYGDLVAKGEVDFDSSGRGVLGNALQMDVMPGAVTSLLSRFGSMPGERPTFNPRITCPVCVCEFEEDDTVLQLPCDRRRHIFHVPCIEQWLSRSQQCPMCRSNIVALMENNPDYMV